MLGTPETKADKGGASACRADGSFIISLFAPTHWGPCLQVGEQGFRGMCESDPLVSGHAPFIEPTGDRTLWEVLRNESETSSSGFPILSLG